MKKFNKNGIVIMLTLALLFGFTSPNIAQAATAPDLGVADSYSIWGKASVTTTGVTHVWGNVGADLLSDIGLINSQVDGTRAGPVTNLQTDATAAYGALNGQGANGTKNLSVPGTITPGVWTIDATQTFTGTTVLDGAGVYIFRSNGAYTVANGATLSLINGATACNVFWQVPGIMTIGTTAHVEGTIITNSGNITLANGATLKGRALSLVASVTLDANQITAPCAAVPVPSRQPATITVIKNVINDSGGNKVISDFPLFVNGTRVTSGVIGTFAAPGPAYTITETSNSNYTRKFSGDCDANGQLNLIPGDNKTCVITNNDIGAPAAVVPPLIDMVKTAYPLSLPAGPGTVVYTYTLRNIGTVPVNNITIVGDTCSPIVLTSGDTNHDAKLDLNETWINTCTQNLSATHTNTAVATGWANGISTTDIASATVIVGAPIIPPLIHVTKSPNLFTVPVGGNVTYTYKVTNPGTAPLANVSITDDKCTGLPTQIIGHPGDLNRNNLLDTNETFTFTCKSKLYATTTNIGTARGYANGLMATDLALATVVVYIPKLPTTGFPLQENNTLAVLAGIMAIGVAFYVMRKKQIV